MPSNKRSTASFSAALFTSQENCNRISKEYEEKITFQRHYASAAQSKRPWRKTEKQKKNK